MADKIADAVLNYLDEENIVYPDTMWPYICNSGCVAINVVKDKAVITHAHFSIETAKDLHSLLGDVIEEAEVRARERRNLQ